MMKRMMLLLLNIILLLLISRSDGTKIKIVNHKSDTIKKSALSSLVCIGDDLCFEFLPDDTVDESAEDDIPMYSSSYFWHLDRIDGQLDGEDFEPKFAGDPDKHAVFIMDTGTQLSHNFFDGNQANHELGYDNYPEEGGPDMDLNGHGTHVGTTVAQIVPGAKIIPCKVLRYDGSGSTTGIIRALAWAVHKTRDQNLTSAVNLSLGGGKSIALDRAVLEASKYLKVVVAAGNSADDACAYSPSGADPGKLYPNFYSVGASDDDDYMARFSNFGVCVNVFAPGVMIRAGWPTQTNRATRSLSGTSMASPVVSGILISLDHRDQLASDDEKQDLGPFTLDNYAEYIMNTGISVARLDKNHTADIERPQSIIVYSNHTNIQFEYAASRFGPTPPHSEATITKQAVYLADDLLCNGIANGDFNNKIVIVNRGGCLFHQKVMTAQNAGAAAVLIRNTDDGTLFSPDYYGSDPSPRIPSAMIPHEWPHGDVPDFITWGSPEFIKVLTFAPTSAPTMAPTVNCRDFVSRRMCTNHSDMCRWKRKWKKCNFRHRE